MAILFMLLPLCNIYSQEKGAREDNSLRIMSYNIRNGRGLDNVSNIQRTADVINKVRPNVVAVQEVDSVTAEAARPTSCVYWLIRHLCFPFMLPQ